MSNEPTPDKDRRPPARDKSATVIRSRRRQSAVVSLTKKQIINLIVQKALPRMVTQARVLGGKYRRRNTAFWRKLGFDAEMQKAAEEKFFSRDLEAEYTMTLGELAHRAMKKDAAETARLNNNIEDKIPDRIESNK